MNLPTKEYFSLPEISNIWSVSKDDLLYYAENGILEISVRPVAIVVGIEQIYEYNNFKSERKNISFSPQPLLPTDIYKIITSSEAVPIYHTKYCFDEQISRIIETKGIMLTYDDLVITRNEKHCFEINNGFCLGQKTSVDIFKHSGDFREIYYDNHRYQFGTMQAKIISLLYAASKTEMPWVHGKYLLNEAGSESLRISSLFRGNVGWRELVFSDRRGYYRLKLPLKHIVPISSQLQLPLAV